MSWTVYNAFKPITTNNKSGFILYDYHFLVSYVPIQYWQNDSQSEKCNVFIIDEK